MKLSNARQKLVAVALLLFWCVALISYRIYLVPGRLEIGLLWNLFLASVPLLWSSGFVSASEKNRPLLAGLFFGLWLLFLPNAPYILTDLIHLRPKPGIPLWLMLAMLLSCAGTGTLLGYLSLLEVHGAVKKRFGPLVGWGMASGSLLLCGFGIYLGRFLRWNSWDLFTRPWVLLQSLVGQFIDPGPHPHPLGVTLVYGVGLIVGYLALRLIAAGSMRLE